MVSIPNRDTISWLDFLSWNWYHTSVSSATHQEKNYEQIKEQLKNIEELMKLAQELMQKMPAEESQKEGTVEDIQSEKKEEDKSE